MFKKIFAKQINSITVAAALVALSSLVSRLLGILRDRILAGQFGASSALDVYYAAFRVPDLIYNLVVLGALSAGFVPIFTAMIKGGQDSGSDPLDGRKNQKLWDLANSVLNILLIGLVALSALGVVFAVPLTRLLTPGFSPEQQELTAGLTRLMFLSPIFLGVSGILGGILQSFKRFFVYSFAPIFYNLGIIVGALYFSQSLGLYGLALGVALGAFLHMAIQWPAVYGLGFRYQLKAYWRDSNVRQIFKMMGPRTLSLAIAQINLVVITIIASALPGGSLAVFNLANNLQSFPIGIFGISFAIAAFPSFSETAFDREKLTAHFSQAARQILFFIVPATVLIIALRAQIIRVILGTGVFDWQDTVDTMNTLGFFALSLFAQALIPLLVRVFYARQDSSTPFYLSLFSVILNIILSFYFGHRLGVAGLALAFSLANIANFIALWLWLQFSVGSLDIGKIINSVLRFTASAIAAGLAAQITKVLVWPFIDMTKFSGVFAQLLAAGLAGTLAYAFFCWLFRSEELMGFLLSLRQRWPFKKVSIDDQGEARGV